MKKLLALAAAVLCVLPLALPAQGAEEPKAYTLTFAGDCTFGCTPAMYYAQVGFIKTVGEDYTYPFRNVADYFSEDDLSIVNLEGPLTEATSLVPKTYNFKGPVSYVNILTENSIEAVTLANNHTHDYGEEGYQSTLEALEGAGVAYVERDSSALVEVDESLTVGLYGAVYYRYPTYEELKAAFDKLRQQGADVIIFLPHWGVEYSYTPSQQQVQTGHDAIDAGADIVCGSHPHVLQPIEYYGDGVIYYSLGNFAFGGNSDPGDYDTALLQQTILVSADGTCSLGELTVVPANISSEKYRNNYQPTPYAEGSAEYAAVLEKLGLSEEE